jgi:hypothetical protein
MRPRASIDYKEAAAALRRVVRTQPGLCHRIEVNENGDFHFLKLTKSDWPSLQEVPVSAGAPEIMRDPFTCHELRQFVEDSYASKTNMTRCAWLGTPGDGGFLAFVLPWYIASGYTSALLPALLEAALMRKELPSATEFTALMEAAGQNRIKLHSRPETTVLGDPPLSSSRRESKEIPLTAALWSEIEKLSRDDGLDVGSIAVAAFAIVAERLAGFPVAIRAVSEAGRLTAADFATLANAATVTCFVPETEHDSFSAAARAAMRLQAVAASGAVGDVPGTDAPVVVSFEFANEDQLLREHHPALGTGEAVLWSRDIGEPDAADELRLVVRPPVGGQPGHIILFGDSRGVGLGHPEVLLSSFVRYLEAATAAPGLPVAVLPHVYEGVSLRLVRPAMGSPAQNDAILVLPMMRGGTAYSEVLAADALKSFDVWTFAFDKGYGELLTDGLFNRLPPVCRLQ